MPGERGMMTLKEMREELGMPVEYFIRVFSIPRDKIDDWESGKETPPQEVLDMVQKTIDRQWPVTAKEAKCLPYTIGDLKIFCDLMIQDGYAEKAVLLSNDNDETGYHGMLFGFQAGDVPEPYITLS